MPPSPFDVSWLQQRLPGCQPACQWQPTFVGLAVHCWIAFLASRCRTKGIRNETHGRVQLHVDQTCESWGAALCYLPSSKTPVHMTAEYWHWRVTSSRMLVMNHNWSATIQHLHPQSVAEISRHSVLSGDRIRQCGTSSGSRHKNTDQCL